MFKEFLKISKQTQNNTKDKSQKSKRKGNKIGKRRWIAKDEIESIWQIKNN